jgi:hypothetical protein
LADFHLKNKTRNIKKSQANKICYMLVQIHLQKIRQAKVKRVKNEKEKKNIISRHVQLRFLIFIFGQIHLTMSMLMHTNSIQDAFFVIKNS